MRDSGRLEKKSDISDCKFFSGRVAALAALLALGACGEVPTDPVACAAYVEASDPSEPTHRVILDGNQWINRDALQPAARNCRDMVSGILKICALAIVDPYRASAPIEGIAKATVPQTLRK